MRFIYGLVLCVMIFFGIDWFVHNASYIPGYGDTAEYLARSKTLVVDQYRTIFYPLVLRLCGIFHNGNTTPFIFWTYLIQALLVAASSAIYATAVFRLFDAPALTIKVRLFVTVLMILLVVTNPLVAHFSLSIMSDSLASSFTVATIGAMAHLVRSVGATPNAARSPWLPTAALCLFLMAVSRVDKLYMGIALAFMLIIYMWIGLKRLPRSQLAIVGAPLFVALVAAITVNHFTQVPDADRPAINLSNLAFNRVVWPRLSQVYPYLPSDAKALISPGDAKWFDEHNNHVYLYLDKLLKGRPENQRIIDEVTTTTLKYFPGRVVAKTVFDVAKYAVPNVSFPLELLSLLPESTATDWTYSRMSQAHPSMTRLWLIISNISFYLIQLPFAVLYLYRRHLQRWWEQPLAFLTVACIGCNAVMFGLEAGMDAHIRYALPTFIMIFELISVASLMWLFDRSGSKSVPGPRERSDALRFE
ncbi:MAG: hypothetical protein IE913_08055 [Halothiobacillus sp.]|nr:hypothetical protein [Halothiobacillus sp.]